MTHTDTYDAGMAVRRAVLGDAYVDRALAAATEFSAPIQDLVTEYCWGQIWTRDGLPRKTRSLLNLATLTALNRPHELALHVRGAINNGVSPAEIQEVFLQSAVYVGMPAALDAFRIAQGVLNELAAEGDAAGHPR